MSDELTPRHLRRRLLEFAAVSVVIGLVVLSGPGLGELRSEVARGSPGWLIGRRRAASALGTLLCGHLSNGASTQQGDPVMTKLPVPAEGILLTHFIVSDDVERSRRFYTEVLGGETVRAGEPSFVALANSWIIINVGGGPTDDKPTVTLETPPSPNRVSSFLNIRVADIKAVYSEWSLRGAEFLTPPKEQATEIRCYVRDPDGHLIEVGQTTRPFPDDTD
jgi:catechol 2,3-dioxygenase-like lactoylglutathione lyase family enzyme